MSTLTSYKDGSLGGGSNMLAFQDGSLGATITLQNKDGTTSTMDAPPPKSVLQKIFPPIDQGFNLLTYIFYGAVATTGAIIYFSTRKKRR